jgi:ATP-dependent RNA helicase DDX46/PRP5
MSSQQRFSGEIIKALELSGMAVPEDVEEMWKTYQETVKGTKIEGKLKTKRRRAIGFTGKGFKFDAKEAARDTEAKLKQKSALGLADSDDEDEFALLTMDKKLEELFSGRARLIDPNAPQLNMQRPTPPNAAASRSLAAASRIADKILMSKNIVAGGSTVTAAQEAASSVMKGEEVNVTGAVLASQIAASINAKVGTGPAKAADAYLPVGTILPKRGDEDGDGQLGGMKDLMRYEEEIEINGFPQQIRFRITTREVLDDVGEYSESYVSVRGIYIPPGQKPKNMEKPLYLKIEAKSERSVTLAKQEVKRVIKEEAQRMASRVGPKQKGGRYSVL